MITETELRAIIDEVDRNIEQLDFMMKEFGKCSHKLEGILLKMQGWGEVPDLTVVELEKFRPDYSMKKLKKHLGVLDETD